MGTAEDPFQCVYREEIKKGGWGAYTVHVAEYLTIETGI